MPHHSARYCKPCSAKLRNDRAVAANRKKYAEKKANRVKKFCACGKDITLLNHLAIRCHECTKTIKAKRNMARYWKGKERKPTQTTCKVCGEPKVEGRLLCQTCKNWDRSEKYYKRRRHMAPKGGRFDYDKFKGYPSHTKEYHRYTAMESIKRRNNKSDPCVYMMQCGGLIYIGQTKRDMELRIQQHKYASQKHGSRIYRAMRSGYEVTYDVLERVAIAELRLAENYYIAAYRDLYGDRVVNERLNRRSAHA
jgi:predicted GIY-YIG superfamily endonuclease